MKRILLVAPIKKAGGIARWTGHLIKYWQKLPTKDIFIEVLPEPTPLFNSFNNQNKIRRFVVGIYNYLGIINNQIKYLRRERFDIVHICSSASWGLLKDLLMLKISQHFHVASIVHFRFGRIPELKEQNNWEWKLLQKVVKMANVVITIDERSYKVLLSEGYENVQNIPNPIAPDVLSVISERKEERQKGYVLFVGQCYPQKGIFELIEASRGIENITVNFIGPINEQILEKMGKKARECGVANIVIQGEKPYDLVIREMKRCTVFVLPTYTEGFPNVILESMACGCPIITTDVGAIPEMLDIKHEGNCGICVKPHDVAALHEAIKKMIVDEEYATYCGMNAQKRVNEQYSMPIVWDKLTRIWESL
ncbi:MAG: glycosyltransferase family 4 protein [Bacteroidales bacterium]|nr:glycosyltransferase family 4 protein [Bacteroidales bacterium]